MSLLMPQHYSVRGTLMVSAARMGATCKFFSLFLLSLPFFLHGSSVLVAA